VTSTPMTTFSPTASPTFTNSEAQISETPGPFTPAVPSLEGPPILTFRGTPVAQLGIHVLQPHEYLFCIGRAYGVRPEAIAEVNSLALDAVLADGRKLLIPDVPWVKIPPGWICTPQFKSPYSSTADSGGEDGSISEEFRLINFVLPKERVKKEGSQLVSLPVTLSPVLTGEIRIIDVELPEKMFLGESGVIKLIFYPDSTGQTGESGPTSTSQPNANATSTPEPEKVVRPFHDPLVVPDVFDNCYITATARLDAIGFSYSPLQDNAQPVNRGTSITWYWSVKPQEAQQQNLIISLRLHFRGKSDTESKCNNDPPPLDGQIWTESFTVNVQKFWFDLYTGYIAAVVGIISAAVPVLQFLFSPRSK
jgi:hypothetical protein